MVSKIHTALLNCQGFIDGIDNRIIKEPTVTRSICVRLDELDVYEVPQNLVKVTNCLDLFFDNRLVVNEDVLNLIFELEKKCEEGVKLWFGFTSDFTQSDWDFLIENIINNSSLKFGEYEFLVYNKTDIIFNFDTDRELCIYKHYNGNLTLKGKMGVVQYDGNLDHFKVEGTVEDVIDLFGHSIVREVFDYDNLPDLYESLETRIRRLIS